MTDKESVVIMPNSWGTGSHSTEAFRNALNHLSETQIKDKETVTVGIYKVEGEYTINQRGTLQAEEILDEREKEIKPEELIEIREIESQVGIMIGELMNGAEITDETRTELTKVIQ